MTHLTVQQRAEAIAGEIFTGGPVRDFERIGRLVLVTMLEEGLYPHSKVLDVGCGALRSGYWLMEFLDPRCYFGIEPDKKMLDAGVERICGPELIERAMPVFSSNDDFDFSVFGTRFDFVLARSIWTHASKQHIATMLDAFSSVANPGAKFLASYIPAMRIALPSGRLGRLGTFARDYKGDEWIGHSHERSRGGLVAHRRAWIVDESRRRGLEAEERRGNVANRQRWMRITAR